MGFSGFHPAFSSLRSSHNPWNIHSYLRLQAFRQTETQPHVRYNHVVNKDDPASRAGQGVEDIGSSHQGWKFLEAFRLYAI